MYSIINRWQKLAGVLVCQGPQPALLPSSRRAVVSYQEFWTVEDLHDGFTVNKEKTGVWVSEEVNNLASNDICFKEQEQNLFHVDNTIQYLVSVGATKPSSDVFQLGIWYSTTFIKDKSSGEDIILHCYLEGYSYEEEKQIWTQMSNPGDPKK